MRFSLIQRFQILVPFIVIILVGCCSHVNPPVSVPINQVSVTQNQSPFNTIQPIVLLIPLQGPLANIGLSIKQGFIAAAQEIGASPQISVIDTSNKSTQAAYTEALTNNAHSIVGPLLKPEVQTIAGLQPTLPVLALNYLNADISTPTELYQFGLSPLDEARQATQLAWATGKRSALIITANGNWGAQIGAAFAQQWQAFGGTVAGQLTLSKNPSAITRQISQFLQFKPPHDRRTDFDVIFLVSNPEIGRQVNPLLKFFYAGDIPVYATASIYSGLQSRRLDQDLNRIIFCAAPWSLANSTVEPALYAQLKATNPNFPRNSQYYALGVDAFHIIQQLPRLSQSPQQTLFGATGLLSLNDHHRLVRQLPCAQFRNGNVVLIKQ